jgi:hypothetical protein
VFPKALGTGTLEGARGTAHVADPDSGVELTGERDIMNQLWNPKTWTVTAAAGRSRTGGTWNGAPGRRAAGAAATGPHEPGPDSTRNGHLPLAGRWPLRLVQQRIQMRSMSFEPMSLVSPTAT